MVEFLKSLKLDAILGPMALPKLDEDKLKHASVNKELILRRADVFHRVIIRTLRILMLMVATIGFVTNYKTALKIYLAILGFLALLLPLLCWWAAPGGLAKKDLSTGLESECTKHQNDDEKNQ